MKKSLKLLGVESSGLDKYGSNLKLKLNDDELFYEAFKLSDLAEREIFLRENLKKNPFGYIKSKYHLAELVKDKDVKYSFDLVFSICRLVPADPKNYFLLAKIAVNNKAWQVAKSLLETVRWLCNDADKELLKDTCLLLEVVFGKIASKEQDNSKGDFWHSKTLDKYWVLERLYYQSQVKDLINYSFKLLDIFPDDFENYEVAFKAILLINKNDVLSDLTKYIENKLSNNKLKQNLYLGMCYFGLSDFETSISKLNEVLKQEPLNSKALFYLALDYLLKNDLKNFVSSSEKILPESDPAFIALYFIYSAVCGLSFDKKEFPNQKNISRELSLILKNLLKHQNSETVKHLILQFKKLEYFKILPYLPFYLSELFIEKKELDYAFELLDGCIDNEVHRIKAWIYRLKGSEELAEQELIKYRKDYVANDDLGLYCKLIDLDLPDTIPSDLNQIFKIIEDAFNQTKSLLQNMDLEYGLNAMTCVETACQDCCTKTFPYVSYIEYLFMRKWLEEQSKEFQEQIKENSIKVVNLYKEKYKKEPPFLTGQVVDLHKNYPRDFIFNCPYLGDNKCNIYSARPFTCRTYSYGSQDGIRYRGCDYFFEQLKSASKLTDVRKVVNMNSFYSFAAKVSEKLINIKVIAPIPVWFAQDHEEIMKKIKKLK